MHIDLQYNQLYTVKTAVTRGAVMVGPRRSRSRNCAVIDEDRYIRYIRYRRNISIILFIHYFVFINYIYYIYYIYLLHLFDVFIILLV